MAKLNTVRKTRQSEQPPVESMTDDSNVDIDYLGDFNVSDFGSEETLNEYCTSSSCVRSKNRTCGKFLSNVWKIDRKSADRIIDFTTQRCEKSENYRISRERSKNYRMIRRDRKDVNFFTDTFIVTRKSKNSTRGNACCQLF